MRRNVQGLQAGGRDSLNFQLGCIVMKAIDQFTNAPLITPGKGMPGCIYPNSRQTLRNRLRNCGLSDAINSLKRYEFSVLHFLKANYGVIRQEPQDQQFLWRQLPRNGPIGN